MSAVPLFPSGVRPPSIGLGFMVQSLGADDHRIAKMAQQVKDVLPHVPLNVITKDLGRAQFQCTFTCGPLVPLYWNVL